MLRNLKIRIGFLSALILCAGFVFEAKATQVIPILYQCSCCEGPVKIFTLLSYFVDDSTVWTDGENWGIPEQQRLLKHPNGHKLFWFEEGACEAVPGNRDDYPEAENPDQNDYFKAIEEGIGSTPEKMKYLRTRIWWMSNDKYRQAASDHAVLERTSAEIDNMEKLLSLLDEKIDDERLMKADLARQLGRFETARDLLRGGFSKDIYQREADFILNLVRQENRFVQAFPEDLVFRGAILPQFGFWGWLGDVTYLDRNLLYVIVGTLSLLLVYILTRIFFLK